ncbi:MAG: hypothetical protein ABEI58_04265 [Candidatus Nanohaloarchaea archaeon]
MPLFDPQINTLVLLLLIVGAFIIAFKIMEMVFQTILVSVLSSGFYLAMVYFFNYPLRLDLVLLFAFLGATFYMGYSFLASAYWLGSKAVKIPYHVLKAALTPLFSAAVYLRKKYRLRKIRSGEGKYDEDEDTDRDVKEVVLDKVRDRD